MAGLRDIRSNVGAAESIRPAVYTAAATGEVVDMRGFDSAVAVVATGAIAGAGNFTFELQESDESGSGFAAVSADDLIGAAVDPLDANSVYRVGYKGNKRYLRAFAEHNSGTSIAMSAVIVMGHADQAPV